MYVYIINQHGRPLMPCRPQKARVLLRKGKATVVKQVPFTIRLLYGSSGYKQPLSLGMDAGSRHIGIAVTSEKKVLYAEELQPRNDVVKLLSQRRQARRARRNRKTRYRQARFDNRVRSKHKGWLAPSVEVKIQEHISAIQRIQRLLPVTEVHVETAEFDTQRLKAMEEENPLPVGFHVHHLETRQTGGNAPNNLITLCSECHKAIHAGKKHLPNKKAKRGCSYKDAAFMGIMRKYLLLRLHDDLDIPVFGTYGYITKYYRELYHVEKSHINDAIIISKHFHAVPDDTYYVSRAVRRHNRQIHKNTIQKGGIRKRNHAPYMVKGFRLFDLVEYDGCLFYMFGRRKSGFMDIRTLDGKKVNKGSVSYKRLKFKSISSRLLIERRQKAMNKIFIEWVSGLVEIDPNSDLGRDVLYYIEKSGNKFTEDVRVVGISPNADCLPAYGRHWCIGWDVDNKIFAVHFDSECEDESTYGKTFFSEERIDQYIDEYLV